MHFGRNAGHFPGKNFPGFGSELRENPGILVGNLVNFEVESLTRHPLVRLPEGDPALLGLGLTHDQSLTKFAMERSPFQVMIELYFLEPSRSPQTFLVPGSRVAGRRFALRLRFGAFENDDIAWHGLRKGRET